jgi:hypothetical protein
MTVRYSVWKDESSQTFEVVMWDGRHPTVVKCGIKSREQAHKAADRLKKQEAGR